MQNILLFFLKSVLPGYSSTPRGRFLNANQGLIEGQVKYVVLVLLAFVACCVFHQMALSPLVEC